MRPWLSVKDRMPGDPPCPVRFFPPHGFGLHGGRTQPRPACLFVELEVVHVALEEYGRLSDVLPAECVSGPPVEVLAGADGVPVDVRDDGSSDFEDDTLFVGAGVRSTQHARKPG